MPNLRLAFQCNGARDSGRPANGVGVVRCVATLTERQCPMSVFYISPTGSGARNGSSLANAGTIASLPRFIAAAGPGGEVLLRADQGAYHLSKQLSLTAGGAATS